MNERRDVRPDMDACQAEDRRGRLGWLVYTEQRVRVYNPIRGGEWEGVIFGLADFPTLLLRLDDGTVRTLPQAFGVEMVTRACDGRPTDADDYGQDYAAQAGEPEPDAQSGGAA